MLNRVLLFVLMVICNTALTYEPEAAHDPLVSTALKYMALPLFQWNSYIGDKPVMQKNLISACLLSKKVRYDGNTVSVSTKILDQCVVEGRVVSICPEVDAGMSIPRAPAELSNGDGYNVWEGTAFVLRMRELM